MDKIVDEIIKSTLMEDIGSGDHSSLSAIPKNATGKAKLLVKADGVIAGIELAEKIFKTYDPNLKVNTFIKDGDHVKFGDIAFTVEGSSISILSTERLVLNFMQRMSGIATQTNKYVSLISDYKTKLLDTRKTTPGIRYMEKWAVRIGGGHNHRYALYDMIMLKDNHIDYAGGIANAIEKANTYIKEKKLELKIEIEVRDFDELNQVLEIGQVDRIMLDNFTPENISKALDLISGQYETEASGGITEETLVDYAKTNVDYISVGALTHSFTSLDMSLKAEF
jgi:nicotinate-nucleotide pyrophosphorylase (carboxylating)